MSAHPADGVLRRYLDEPVAVAETDRAHLTTCPRCTEALRAVDADRAVARHALDLLEVPAPARPPSPAVVVALSGMADEVHRADEAHLDSAWASLVARLDGDGPCGTGAGPRTSRSWGSGSRGARPSRRVLRAHPVAAAVAAGLVLVGGTAAAAAADWLPIFRTEKVAAVTLSTADVTALGDLQRLAALSAYGTVKLPSGDGVEQVLDAATAAARSGVAMPSVAHLPVGVEGKPTYAVLDHETVEFTFSTASAARTAAGRGVTLPPPPPGLDGSTLRVEGGPGVAVSWGEHHGVPTMVLARVKAPVVSSQGAPLATVRDYLLSLPGIPQSLASQLRALTADGTTLPVPVPTDLATSSPVVVGSSQATLVQTKDRLAAGVLWVDHGMLQAVGGTLSRDDVLEVARGLR